MTILQILVAARWVHFAALFLLFGAPLSCALVRGCETASKASIFDKTDRLLRIAAVVTAASGLVWIAAIIANMAGGFAEAATADTLNAFFFATQFGPIVIIRLILLAAAVLVIALPLRIRLGTWFCIGAGLLIDQAWLGHAANGGATLLGAMMIAVYSAHVLAGSAWIGGLPVLLFVIRARFEDRSEKAKILLRFSTMATAAVALIVLSGLGNASFRVHGHMTRLFGTGYGDILLVKVVLVAVMLVFAAYNRLIAVPRLGRPAAARTSPKLVASIAIELVLGAAVIGAAALLGVTPPPE
jgi:putative copper resistance protein D